MYKAKVTGVGASLLGKGTAVVYRKWVKLDSSKGLPSAGDLVAIETPWGGTACGLWEPQGPVALRIVDHWDCPYRSPVEAFEDRLLRALRVRERSGLRGTQSYRLVNSDGDLLSGLIIDVFNDDIAVLQSSSYAVDKHIEDIAHIVSRLTGAGNVFEKSTQRSRRDIGLESRRRWLLGGKKRTIVVEDGARFVVDVEHGQKTGFYLDQRPNRIELEGFVSPGDSVLDVFSYTGGFGIHAALAGAGLVVFVEEDPDAVSLLKENIKLNNIKNYKIINSSIWKIMSRHEKQYNIVVVDPPAFIQRGDDESIRKGTKAYTRVFSWGLERLVDGGVAYLSSCSYFLTRERFLQVISKAARRISVEYVILGRLRGAGDDHVLRTAEYLEYLKGAFLTIEKYDRNII